MTWWSVLRRRALIKPGFDPLPDLSPGCADATFLLLRPDGMGRRSWTTESTEASQPQHQLLGHLRAVPHDYSLLDDRRRFSPGMVRPAQDWSALAVKDPLPTLLTPVFSAPPLSWHLWKIKMRNAFCFYDKQVISMIFFFISGETHWRDGYSVVLLRFQHLHFGRGCWEKSKNVSCGLRLSLV